MKRTILSMMVLLSSSPLFAQTATTTPSAPTAQDQQAAASEWTRIASQLGLDATATAQFIQTNQKYQAQVQPLQQDAKQTEQTLRQELAQPQPDAARLSQLSDALTNDHDRISAIEQQQLADFRQQLTPAQYAQLLINRRTAGRAMHQR